MSFKPRSLFPLQARRDTKDEPWAWQSREYLRKKVIGKAVVFKVDYAVPSINREFGSVFMDDTNLALDVVANGWARVSNYTQSVHCGHAISLSTFACFLQKQAMGALASILVSIQAHSSVLRRGCGLKLLRLR